MRRGRAPLPLQMRIKLVCREVVGFKVILEGPFLLLDSLACICVCAIVCARELWAPSWWHHVVRLCG